MSLSTITKILRRQWLQAAGGALAMAATATSGCGGRAAKLKVFNWSDYIDGDLIADFERRHDCTVVYDNYSSDSELETRLATGAGSYDVVFPSDRALVALKAKDLLQPIEPSRVPNIRHLDGKFLGRPFDPENQFSVPYFVGTLAVGVRSDRVPDEFEGLEPLFDVANRGRITMLDDMENVVAAALCHLQRPLNSVEPEDLLAAETLLLAQRPLVQGYTSDAYRARLISGEAWACLGWSGDLLQADRQLAEGSRGARVKVVLPRQGTMLWMDSMVIPRRAQNVELAHAFIDYLLQPEVAAVNAKMVNYATPNAAARKLLPPEMLANESIYPPVELLERSTWLEDRGREIEKVEGVWRRVRA